VKQLQPTRPETLDPLAVEILERLRAHPEAAELVLGGQFALKHYHDFRATHDIDAWWRDTPSATTLELLRKTFRDISQERGFTYSERAFGDTISLEMSEGNARTFSFQVAARSVELEAPVRGGPWDPIAIESLSDNVGAKMNALVNRGLPRDFVDINAVVAAGIVSKDECWALWRAKNPGQYDSMARSQVKKHLDRLEQTRPLASIANDEERAIAKSTRTFFKEQFLGLGHGHGR
jgi:hypothetical protein